MGEGTKTVQEILLTYFQIMAFKGEGGSAAETKVNKDVKFKRKSGEAERETYKRKEMWTEKAEPGEGLLGR